MMRYVLGAVLLGGCLGAQATHASGETIREVTATAYTLRESETKVGNVGLAAWGDQLKPGMKAIAVSRDLIEQGLTHGTEVTIEGLEGIYVVRDKMHWRWQNKIDIFMGRDVAKALDWGKRTVTIRYQAPH